MLRIKSSTLCLKNFSRVCSLTFSRQLCSQQPDVPGISNLRDSLAEKIEVLQQQQQQQQSSFHSLKASIYRVPTKLRDIEQKAYEPRVISIGPYHHGSPNLQVLEVLKFDSLNRVVGSGERGRVELNRLLSILEGVEPEARDCFSEEVKLSRDAFVEMMLLDGCFIVELFRDLKINNFASSSLLPKRWMLPVVRRDLIILENQLPMIVLKKIFEETMKSNPQLNSIESLALNFFNPLMPREDALLLQSIESIKSSPTKFHHLLDVFHSSIALEKGASRGEEPHMYRPLTELKKEGIKVRILKDRQPLEMRFERGVLRMPGFRIDNHTGCVLKNLVAYEQCHQECIPDVTSYLFFLDKLVNSGEDVAMLQYEGVLQHSLGSNNQVARLISDLCRDVEHDGSESYLFELIKDLNSHTDKKWVKLKSRLKQDYFGNVWVSISTVVAIVLLYLTLLQATYNALKSQKKKFHREINGLWALLHYCLLNPAEALCEATTNFFSNFEAKYDTSEDERQIN